MNNRESLLSESDVFERLQRRLAQMQSERGSTDSTEGLAQKLAKRAQALRDQLVDDKLAGPQMSILTFRQGTRQFGIPVANVIEVQPLCDYTPVPGAPHFVAGVVHWRGAIISLLDLGKLFHFHASGLVDDAAFLVVEVAGRRVGVVASELEELRTIAMSEIKAAPDLASEIPTEWIVGVCDQVRLILSLDQILHGECLEEWRD